jgi:SPFH domain / Band 7 family
MRVCHSRGDVSGQEIMTADKVAVGCGGRCATGTREVLGSLACGLGSVGLLLAALLMRSAFGTRELDALLSEKDRVADELMGIVKGKASALGVEVTGLGIRDVILPGEMKDLLNKVTEAKKAAEAALITRREETAAMRSQSNTARIFEGSPTLMRLKELETLEKIADKAKLSVVLGEKGLAEKVVKMI